MLGASVLFRASLLAVLPVPLSPPLVFWDGIAVLSLEARGVEVREATLVSALGGVEDREPAFPSERGDEARELGLLLERADDATEPALEAVGLFKEWMPVDVLLICSSAADPFCTSSFMLSPVLSGGGAEAEATTTKVSVDRADMLCSPIVRFGCVAAIAKPAGKWQCLQENPVTACRLVGGKHRLQGRVSSACQMWKCAAPRN